MEKLNGQPPPAATERAPRLRGRGAASLGEADDSGLLLKAVLAGQGAGLLPAALVELDRAEGRLVKLADVVRLEAFAYYLVYPEASHERPNVAAFRAWILKAATGDPAHAIAMSGTRAA